MPTIFPEKTTTPSEKESNSDGQDIVEPYVGEKTSHAPTLSEDDQEEDNADSGDENEEEVVDDDAASPEENTDEYAEFDEEDFDDDFDAMMNEDPNQQTMYNVFNTIPVSDMIKYMTIHGKVYNFIAPITAKNSNFQTKKTNASYPSNKMVKKQHILLSQQFDCNVLTKCVIEFDIQNHFEDSVIGLLEYPLQYGCLEDNSDSDEENEEEKDTAQ